MTTGTAVQLANIFGADEPTLDIPCGVITIQPRPANTQVIYIGGSDVSSTVYAFRLEVPAAGPIPPAPFVFEGIEGRLRLGEIYALGTTGDYLQIGIVY